MKKDIVNLENNKEMRKGEDNMIRIFKNEEFGEVRTLVIDNVPYFVGKDVAKVLGYKNLGVAVNQHVEREDCKALKYKALRDSYPSLWINKNDYSDKIVINESGVYSLIFGSELPTAKKFKRWVTSDVLPSIRKHGAYMTEETLERAIADPDFLIKLATELKNEKEKRRLLEEEKKINEPKVIFADAVNVSKTNITIGSLAKLLKQNGIQVGRNRLFDWLRENNYLISKGSDKNMPTQRSMEMGLFEVKEGTICKPNGEVTLTKTTTVTGKGQQFFINRILKAFEE